VDLWDDNVLHKRLKKHEVGCNPLSLTLQQQAVSAGDAKWMNAQKNKICSTHRSQEINSKHSRKNMKEKKNQLDGRAADWKTVL
jgi:hypothetical protein